jgi:hypothetical protein
MQDRGATMPVFAALARAPRSCMVMLRRKLSRSVATRSSTSRAGCPAAAESAKALSTRTGPLVSSTMREPPCMIRP